MGRKAKSERDVEIILDVFAVGTDKDLAGLSITRWDISRGIIMGVEKPKGLDGVRSNESGAEAARQSGGKLVATVRASDRVNEADAFLLIAGAAGGTGSGALPVLTRQLKEYFLKKPAYNLVVLPSARQEEADRRASYNAGTCLKSAYLAADAVFLADNQRFAGRDESSKEHPEKVNEQIAAPFYNLFCAGEERKARHIGAKTMDAGDIIQSLAGWSVAGQGHASAAWSKKPAVKPGSGSGGAQGGSDEVALVEKAVRLIGEALHAVPIECDPRDARRALYLLTAPHEAMNMYLIGQVGNLMRREAPSAVIRGGDYPRDRRQMELSLLLSELTAVGRVTDIFGRTIDYMNLGKPKRRRKAVDALPDEEAFGDIPLLL
jgi:cell division GTPase FtsZ